MKTEFYFFIQLPGKEPSVWVGSGVKKSKRAGFIWITKADGSKFAELPEKYVSPIDRQIAQHLIATYGNQAIDRTSAFASAPTGV